MPDVLYDDLIGRHFINDQIFADRKSPKPRLAYDDANMWMVSSQIRNLFNPSHEPRSRRRVVASNVAKDVVEIG